MITLLANTHGLLTKVVPIWLKLSKSDSKEFTTDAEVADFIRQEMPQLYDSESEAEFSEGEIHRKAPRAWAGRRHGKQATNSDNVAIDWAERNRRNRTEVKTWAK